MVLLGEGTGVGDGVGDGAGDDDPRALGLGLGVLPLGRQYVSHTVRLRTLDPSIRPAPSP